MKSREELLVETLNMAGHRAATLKAYIIQSMAAQLSSRKLKV
jgi:hypothetical protein